MGACSASPLPPFPLFGLLVAAMYSYTAFGTTQSEVVADNVHKIGLMTTACGGLEGEEEVLFLGKDPYLKRIVTAQITVPVAVQHQMQIGPSYSEDAAPIQSKRPEKLLDSSDVFLSKLEKELGGQSG